MSILTIKTAKLSLKMVTICLMPHNGSIGRGKIQTHTPLLPESLFLPLHTFVLHHRSFSSPCPSSSPHTSVVLSCTFVLPEKLKKILMPSPTPTITPRRSDWMVCSGTQWPASFKVPRSDPNVLSRLRNTAKNQLLTITEFGPFSF